MAAKAHHLEDCWPAIGLVRDAEQRDAMFYDLASSIANRDAIDLVEFEIAPPEWQWYRINPCSPHLCGEHAWHYDDGTPGQRGSFVGALIVIRRREPAVA